MINEKKFPEGMVPLTGDPFMFSCHAGVRCFTVCCKNVDMILYPYDIIRLKTVLAVSSSEFLQRYTRLVQGDNPYFPTVMLKVRDDEEKSCPFLSADGCSVYLDRPSACRMYPLERAVDRTPDKHRSREYYFLVKHSYCYGHEETSTYTVREWVRDQRLDEYNVMNELWTEIDTVFSGNPMPDAFAITPLNVCEKQMAARLIGRCGGGGYLLGDAHYDASWLFDYCAHYDHQLVFPRAKPNTALGHHYVSPHRLRAIEMLEPPGRINGFGARLYDQRTGIERDFSGLVCFGGGLTTLPPWIRRIWRVRPWVTAKLLINAARIRLNRKKAG